MTLSVPWSLGPLEPTNSQSIEVRNAMETNNTVVKVRNTLDRAYGASKSDPRHKKTLGFRI